jgi:hypothetical protein
VTFAYAQLRLKAQDVTAAKNKTTCPRKPHSSDVAFEGSATLL